MNSLDFNNDFEYTYFEEWKRLCQGALYGASGTRLWAVWMPQLTRHNRALRHAALGIAAMNMALSNGGIYSPDPHHANAIAYYCHALHLQAQAEQEATATRDLLLISILFTAFEALRGHRRPAFRHVRCGFAVLENLLAADLASTKRLQAVPEPGEFIGEILGTYSYFSFQVQNVIEARPDCVLLASQNLVRRLKHKGHTIDSLGMKYLLPQSEPWRRPFTVFDTIEEARKHWAAMERRITGHGALLVSAIETVSTVDANDTEAVDRVFDAIENRPELLAFVYDSQEQIRRWSEAFEALFIRIMTAPHLDKSQIFQVLDMKVECVARRLYSLFPKHSDYDTVASLTPVFQELDALCKILIQQQQQCGDPKRRSSKFTMHSTVMWHLLFIALNCRDITVRERAIGTLGACSRRDCFWDSSAFLAIAQRNRDIESENTQDGTPAQQWRRLCRRVFLFEECIDTETGVTLVLRAMRLSSHSSTWEYTEEFAPLDGSADVVWRRRLVGSKSLVLQWGRTSSLIR